MRSQDDSGDIYPGGAPAQPGDWWTTNVPEVNSFLPGSENVTAPIATPTAAGTDPSAYFNQLFPGDYLDSSMLLAHEAELAAQGIKVLRNAEGRAGKIQLPNGQIVDVVQGGSSGLNRKQWLTGGAGGGAGGVGVQGGIGGTLIDPWTKPFVARSPAEIANDPAYQFQMAEGLKGIERGAAAKGTLLTGGTLKGAMGYGQGLASTYNDKYYNRDMNEYLLGRENFQMNQDRPFNKLSSLAQLGKPSSS